MPSSTIIDVCTQKKLNCALDDSIYPDRNNIFRICNWLIKPFKEKRFLQIRGKNIKHRNSTAL